MVLAQKVLGSNLALGCKKPMVLASNRGRYSSKNLNLVEWWARQDSNLQGFPHVVLSHARLPFRHSPKPAKHFSFRRLTTKMAR
jgi:hypothetical protein